jgi:hypothetical protein
MNAEMVHNYNIPMNSKWAVTNEQGGTFFYTITNGWQMKHATVEDSVAWQFPRLAGTAFKVCRFR